MSSPVSIESVKTEFDLWRQQKKAPQCRTPELLRQKALALRAHHSKREIIKALSISYSRLAAWESAMLLPAESVSPVKPEFVPLTLDNPTKTVAKPDEVSITCEQTNGSRWQLQGHFTAQQLSAFVTALNHSSGGCS